MGLFDAEITVTALDYGATSGYLEGNLTTAHRDLKFKSGKFI